MRFAHEFFVDAAPEIVWDFLVDVPRMAGCIPGAAAVSPIDPATYEAVVSARIGPITARFDCRIAILDLDHAARIGAVELSGKDIRLGGGVKARMQMRLSGAQTTTVQIESEVDMLGKIGQYGHGMVSKRADAMLVEFASCVQEQVATRQS